MRFFHKWKTTSDGAPRRRQAALNNEQGNIEKRKTIKSKIRFNRLDSKKMLRRGERIGHNLRQESVEAYIKTAENLMKDLGIFEEMHPTPTELVTEKLPDRIGKRNTPGDPAKFSRGSQNQ